MKRRPRAPEPLGLRLAVRFLPREVREEVLGDLLEEWERDVADAGWFKRVMSGWGQVPTAIAARIRYGRSSRQTTTSLSGTSVGLGSSLLDLKLGIRLLKKEPLLTFVAIVALALGIPSSLAPIHAMNAFLSPLPVDQGEQIVGIRNWNTSTNRPVRRPLHDYEVWREELTSFQQIGAARSDPWNVHSEDGTAAPVRGSEVTASLFDMLRVPPLMGRWLVESDESPGAPNVVVLGADTWQTRFGSDPDIVGKSIGVGSALHVVVGVMPEGFTFPVADYLWLPLRENATAYTIGTGPDLNVYGRLKEGVSQATALAELETVGRRLAIEWPESHTLYQPQIVPHYVMLTGMAANQATSAEVLLLQLFCFVLLAVACGNVGIMILARTATRLGEIALRTAIGASRIRIVFQIFLESLIVALIATTIGLLLANAVASHFESLANLPYGFDLNIGWTSALLALGLAVVCAVGAGVFPALKATGPKVQQNLQRAAAGKATIKFGLFSAALIVVEVAISVGVLSVGSVAMQSVVRDTAGENGIDFDRYLVAFLRTPWEDRGGERVDAHVGDSWIKVQATQEELKNRLQADPSVRAVAMGRNLPGMGHESRPIEFEGDEALVEFGSARVLTASVDVNFFQDLGRPVLAGRAFSLADIPEERGSHRPAVVVNTSFVDNVLGGGSALGKRFRYVARQGQDPNPWYEIVGVVGPLGMNPSNPAQDAGVYHPTGPGEVHPIRYIVEVVGDPITFAPRMRAIASGIDPAALIQEAQPLTAIIEEEESETLFVASFLTGLSGIAALLSITGLYALMCFTVAQRTREIGIRTALGAGPKRIVEAIARRASIQLLAGVLGGSALAALLLQDLDASIKPTNIPLVVMIVGGGVILLGAVACLVPTLRGLRISPTQALRDG